MKSSLIKYGYIKKKKSFWLDDEESFNKIVRIAKRRKFKSKIARKVGFIGLKRFLKSKILRQKISKTFQTELLNKGEFFKIKELSAIASNATIKKLVKNYLGSKVQLTGCGIWYNYLTSKENHIYSKSQKFHCDTGPEKSYLKVFIPLQEINSKNGPFTFYDAQYTKELKQDLRDSVLSKNKRFKNLFEDSDVYSHFVEKKQQKFIGSEGDLTICDVSRCLHQGARVEEGDRLMLIFVFSNLPRENDLSKKVLEKKKYLFF